MVAVSPECHGPVGLVGMAVESSVDPSLIFVVAVRGQCPLRSDSYEYGL